MTAEEQVITEQQQALSEIVLTNQLTVDQVSTDPLTMDQLSTEQQPSTQTTTEPEVMEENTVKGGAVKLDSRRQDIIQQKKISRAESVK